MHQSFKVNAERGDQRNGKTLVLAVFFSLAIILALILDAQIPTSGVEIAISKGISFLEKRQLENGGFESRQSSFQDFRVSIDRHTVFIGALVSNSLIFSGLRDTDMVKKTLRFLLEERSQNNFWNFQGNKKENRIYEIPEDLDDTAMAVLALETGGTPVDAEIFYEMKKFMTGYGYFLTWINDTQNAYVKDGAGIYGNVVDCSVNANILAAFLARGKKIRETCEYLNRIVEEKSFPACSTYYPSENAFTYFISRAKTLDKIDCLKIQNLNEYVLKKQRDDGSFGNALETCLALNSLLYNDYHGVEASKAVNFILKNQEEDGGWNAYVFFYEGYNDFWGSRDLTTALCIEALSNYIKR